MPGRAATTVVTTAVLLGAVSGCGGGGGGGSAGTPKDAVTSYFKALGGKDYSGACDLISAKSQQAIASRAGGKKCPDALKSALGGKSLDQLKNAKTGAVNVKGDSGTVTVTVNGQTQPIQVIKEGGKWKVSSQSGG